MRSMAAITFSSASPTASGFVAGRTSTGHVTAPGRMAPQAVTTGCSVETESGVEGHRFSISCEHWIVPGLSGSPCERASLSRFAADARPWRPGTVPSCDSIQ